MGYASDWQISDVEQEMEGMLHGTTLNQITNLYGVFNRAARRILNLVDPQETKVVAQFGKVYQGVFDYNCFVDQKGNKVIDFYPQANRTLLDNYGQQYTKPFNLWKNYTAYDSFTPRYNNGIRTLRVNAVNLPSGVQVNAADAVSDNGTWATSGNANTPTTNNLIYQDGVSSSVSFNLAQTGTPGSVGTITNATMTPSNLSVNYNNDDEFFWVYLPNASGITSLIFTFGTNATNNYVSAAISTDAMGDSWVNGWNLIKVPWANMTIVNAPNPASIGYISVAFTYNGTLQVGVCINQFYSRTGTYFVEEYYSKYLFADSATRAFKERVTADTDYVNLDEDGLNMFVWASFAEAVHQQQGLAAVFADGPSAEQHFQEEMAAYKGKYKSEIIKPRDFYYAPNNPSYRRFFGYGRLPPG